MGGQRRRVHIRFYQDNEELSSQERIRRHGEEVYTLFLRKRRGSLRKAYTREGLRSGILGPTASQCVYAIINTMKGFLHRSVYAGRARKCIRYF